MTGELAVTTAVLVAVELSLPIGAGAETGSAVVVVSGATETAAVSSFSGAIVVGLLSTGVTLDNVTTEGWTASRWTGGC